jgi:di/tricarboxylate transporter
VRQPGAARRVEIRRGDVLVLKADAAGIEGFVGSLRLEYAGSSKGKNGLPESEQTMLEAVVPRGSRAEKRSARSMRLMYRHGVTLLGVSRQGRRISDRVRELELQAGDVLLLLGERERLEDIVGWMGCLPLAGRGLQLVQRSKAGLAVSIFAAAVVLASMGVLYLPVALGVAAVLMVLAGIIPVQRVYDAIEWPVIVLLGSMIPIGVALESSGGTALIADSLTGLTADFSPVVVLLVLMAVTMTLSDVMNNVATAVIAAPVAVQVANSLDVNPDAFLMGVAVAASCAFLTPIGHKNNTLVMGPGGYRFGDYWRMGLPLEILVLLVALPMILWVWPL